jgi:PAS domain S-box-containing protein
MSRHERPGPGAPPPANAAESEATYRSIVENAVAGMFQTSPDGRYLTANRALARIYGYESAEALTATVTDIGGQLYVDPNRREEFRQRLQSGDIVEGFESEIYRRDGSVIWISESARAVRAPDGTLLHYEGHVQDITARKQAELALAYSRAELQSHREHLEETVAARTADLRALNEQLREEMAEREHAETALRDSQDRIVALIDSVADIVALVDLDGTVRFVNGSLERLLGVAPADVEGGSVFALVHADDRPKLESYWNHVVHSEGSGPAIQFRSRHADGSWRILETIANNLLGHAAVRGVVFNARDVTEREQAKAALYLRDHAIASTSEGITISDPQRPDHPLIYVNSGFERLTGYQRDEVIGRNCRYLQGPDTDPAAVATIRAALAAERHCTVEVLNYRKDGTPFWNLLSITPVRNSAGNVTHFIGVQVDITKRKEIERLKNELVATVSHELRTPLASLRGFAELMLQRVYTPAQQREFLRIIHQEAMRLGKLIDDFLDLQRMESGRETWRFEDVDLKPALDETLALFTPTTTQHTLRLEVDERLPRVRANTDRVRQALVNLIANAIKFSPAGGEVRVAARAEPDAVTLSVRDHGIGMSPEAMRELFTKFYRVDNAETRRIGGTGLGLALVKEIATAHGGRVWVESALGAGSTFHLTLPRADAVRPDASERADAADAVAARG